MTKASNDDLLLDAKTARRAESAPAAVPALQGVADGTCLIAFDADGSRVHPLPAHGDVVVGRGSDVDIRLSDASVSRRHAKLRLEGGEAWIHDLGSQNGTLVNGERIASPRVLVTGDVLTLSDVTLVYRATVSRPRSLVSFADLHARTDDELARAGRHERPLTLLCANFRGSPKRTEIEAMLASGLRRGEVAAWAGDDQLLILLPDTTPSTSSRVASLLGSDARIGTAAFPNDAERVDELVAAARAAAATPSPAPGRPRSVAGRNVVIADPAMARLYALAERLAVATLPVLVYGETGTGKELLATALHELSPRRTGPFITLNCAAVHDTLFESELFGHQKGAFTGATTAKPGLIERADRGTLFLDEVGDMPAATQAKLLRVLETKRTMRLGSVEDQAVDFRLVTATNRDLEDEVRAGRFRADLYFRVSGGVLRIPPLRERPDEIALLARTLLDEACKQLGRRPMAFSVDAMRALEDHAWPGNVRELKNLIDYVAAAVVGDSIESPHVVERLGKPQVPEPAMRAGSSDLTSFRPISEEIDALEERRMREALAATGGNISKAAQLIGMPNRTFFKRMKKFGLARERE